MTEDISAPESETDGLDEREIRARAFEISQRPDSGSPDENWNRAVAELHAEKAQGK